MSEEAADDAADDGVISLALEASMIALRSSSDITSLEYEGKICSGS